jgi:hypothetical protein
LVQTVAPVVELDQHVAVGRHAAVDGRGVAGAGRGVGDVLP